MTLIIPEKIKKGNTIGFISPSAGLAPFAMHRIEKAVLLFEKLGYKVKFGKNSMKNDGYVSASVQERVDDIHEMFQDKNVKMIIATIGGNHSNQLIRHLNYDLIKKNPKAFIGYSDNTVLHYALQSKGQLASFYGPCVITQFGEYPKIFEYTLEYFGRALFEEKNSNSYRVEPSELWTEEFLDWFTKKDLLRPREMRKNKGYEWLIEGKAEGEFLGGAIPSINHLAGTEYWCDPKNKIFFIDIPEGHVPSEGLSLQDVDSYFADLDNLGVFDSIAGLIIGRPFCYSNEISEELKKIILKYTGEKKYPILYNFDMGHTDPMVTIRFGARIKLDSKSNLVEVLD